MQRAALKRLNLRHALERGPLGALAAPETGFVWDAACGVWERLSLPDKVALYMAGWPFSKRRWLVLVTYSQGGRVEYGPVSTNWYGFGEHTRRSLTIVGLGYQIDTDGWCVMDDYQQLGKLFALLRRNGGLAPDGARHSRSADRWRATLVRLM